MWRKIVAEVALFATLVSSADAGSGRVRAPQKLLLLGNAPSASAPAPLNFLRVVTPLNGNLNAGGVASSGTINQFSFRAPIEIAQDCAQLVLSFNMWGMTNAGDVGVGNAMTIIDMALDSGTSATPVTISGVSNPVIADLTVDQHSDVINPPPGKTKFTRGENYFIKITASIPATSGHMPTKQMPPLATVSGFQGVRYDPAVTTVSASATPGAFTFTGTAPAVVSGNGIYMPIVLGFPYVDQISLIATGDSEIAGLTDVVSGINGTGYFQRGLTQADGISNPFPAMNFSVSGQGTPASTGTNNKWSFFAKYANLGFPALLTNDIGAATTIDAATSNFLLTVQLMQAQGIKRILRPELFPNTTDTTTAFSTLAGQAGQAGWTAGAVAPQTNAYFASRQNDQLIQSILSASDLRDPTQTVLWEVSGTTLVTGNVSINSGSSNLTVSSAAFTAADVGKQITIPGAGTSGGTLNGRILTVTDSTHVVLTAAVAGTTLTNSSQTVGYGMPTPDGKHPTPQYHGIHGAALQTLLAAMPNTYPTPSVLSPSFNPYDTDLVIGNVFSNSNLTVTRTSAIAGQAVTRATTCVTTGKSYWEVRVDNNVAGALSINVAGIGSILSNGNTAQSLFYAPSGLAGGGGASSNSNVGSFTTGATIDIALDETVSPPRVAIRKNNGNWNGNAANDPAVGFYSLTTVAAGWALCPAVTTGTQNDAMTIIFSGFTNPAPAGYSPITGGGV